MSIQSFNDCYEIKLPTVVVVCYRCGGRGMHTNPAIDGNGISSEEMHERGEEFLEDYLGGLYDITCQECNGRNVVEEVDEAKLDPATLKEWRQWLQDEADVYAMEAAERAYGC